MAASKLSSSAGSDPGVTQLGRDGAVTTGRLYMAGHGIDEHDGVASLGQGCGVQPAGTADVDDAGPCGHVLAHYLLCPLEFQHTLPRPANEAIALVELGAARTSQAPYAEPVPVADPLRNERDRTA